MTSRSTCSKYTPRRTVRSFKSADRSYLFSSTNLLHPPCIPRRTFALIPPINRSRDTSPRVSYSRTSSLCISRHPSTRETSRRDANAFKRNVAIHRRVLGTRTSSIIIKERRKSLNGRRIGGGERKRGRKVDDANESSSRNSISRHR